MGGAIGASVGIVIGVGSAIVRVSKQKNTKSNLYSYTLSLLEAARVARVVLHKAIAVPLTLPVLKLLQVLLLQIVRKRLRQSNQKGREVAIITAITMNVTIKKMIKLQKVNSILNQTRSPNRPITSLKKMGSDAVARIRSL